MTATSREIEWVDQQETARPSLTFGGIILEGISEKNLLSGHLKIQIPMSEGCFSLQGPANDIHIMTKPNTTCTITVQLGKSKDTIQIESADLIFSRCLRIKNPSQSLEKTGSRWGKILEDSVVDLAFSGIHIDNEEQIKLIAHAKILGLFRKELSQNINNQLQLGQSHQIDIPRLLKNLGIMTQQGTFELALDTQPVAMSLKKKCRSISTQEQAIEVRSCGTCHFDVERGLVIELPKQQTHLKTGAIDLDVSGDIALSVNQDRHLVMSSLNWTCDAKGKSARISVDGFNVNFDGDSHLNVRARNSSINLQTMKGHTEGHTHLEIKMSAITRHNYPKVKTFEQDADFVFDEDGMATIHKNHNGITDFISPFTLVAGWPIRIPDPKGIYDFSVDSPEFKSLIEKKTGAKIRSHTKTTLLPDGVTSLPARLKLIQEAKEFVFLQTHIFKDDETSNQIADALIDAVKRGLPVYVIIDSMGNALDSLSMSNMLNEQPIYQKLRGGGVRLALYNSMLEQGLRQILQVLNAHPEIAGIQDLTDLKKAKNLLRTAHRLALAAQDDLPDVVVTAAEQELLQTALKNVFNETPDSTSSALIEDLRKISANNVLDLSALFTVFERIPNFHVRSHEKILATENGAIIGGINTSNAYLRGGIDPQAYRDTDMLLQGAGEIDVLRAFDRNWHSLTDESLTSLQARLVIQESMKDGSDIQIIHHVPPIDHDHHISSAIIHALKTLKSGEKAYFEQAYFLPTGALESLKIAMMEAAKRGVDIRVFTNSAESSDMKKALRGNIFCYRELLKAGVRIYEKKGTQMVHSKVCSFNGKVAVIGSWNTDNRSDSINPEIAGVVYDSELAAQLEKRIESTFDPSFSTELSYEKLRRRAISIEFENIIQSSVDDLL